MVNNDIAMRFLQAAGRPSSKQQLLDSEILILKTLHFNVNVPNPLTFVETLLEVLGKIIFSGGICEFRSLVIAVFGVFTQVIMTGRSVWRSCIRCVCVCCGSFICRGRSSTARCSSLPPDAPVLHKSKGAGLYF